MLSRLELRELHGYKVGYIKHYVLRVAYRIKRMWSGLVIPMKHTYIEGYNTLDGRVSGLRQIRLGIAMGKWFIQLNLFVYSIKFGIYDK
jgi:hypothetical protein